MSRPANELESKVIVLGLSQSGKTSMLFLKDLHQNQHQEIPLQ